MTLRMILTAVLLVVATAYGASALDESSGTDESRIRDLQKRQQDAWNRHDAKAYAALFAEDGDAVNVVGWWWKGRQEIESKLTAAYAVVFRESTLTITDVQVRFLTPEIAVAHVRWSMRGARTPPSIPEPREGIEIQVLQKHGATWQIAAFQNTHSRPEIPFPTAPPQP